MDVGSKNLYKDKSDVRNSELSPKIEVGQKAKPFILKKGVTCKVGQDNMMCKCWPPHEHNCSKGATWKSGKRTFYCIYYYKKKLDVRY